MDKVIDKIIRKPNIWDLHIHTPLGTPTKKNYGNIEAAQFVDSILDIYNKADNKIGMISFTDHNKINADAYKAFVSKSDIAIIPGIEIDIYLTENAAASKHIIFYFDEQEIENIEGLKKLIEEFIGSHTRVCFEEFVMLLIENKKRFAVSPHAFKQDKRGIDFDWFDEEAANRGTTEFTGLFFPFWEAGGKSDICKAIEFLNEQYGDDENQQAIIAFSDSADYKKLKDYIDNPHQYFLCLNSFKGLLLAGSDISRIVYEREERPDRNPSEKIKNITLSDNMKPVKKSNCIEIELSDRLNVIVGGRGKGKSALLDAMVAAMNTGKIENRDRLSFVKKFDVQITNFNNTKLSSDINFLYFSQSYINKLFDGNSQEKFEEFFKKEFDQNTKISNGIADLLTSLENREEVKYSEDINVADDLKNLIIIRGAAPSIQIKRKNIKSIDIIRNNQNYLELIKEVLPDDSELWDEELNAKLKDFVKLLLEKICKANYKSMLDVGFSNNFKKKIDQQNRKKSSENKKKIISKGNIEKKLRFLYEDELKLIRQINRLYKIKKEKTELKMQVVESDGEENNKFYFVSVADKEHPVEFAKRILVDSANKARKKNFDKCNVSEVFCEYATSREFESVLKDSCSFQELINKIETLEGIRAKKIQRIIYKNNETYTDLHKTSPGSQTNAVMEYILHSESTVPLLIDQPEDNIDNEARYSQLTKWIRKQKYNRQIILVTHDANIVINGDAECVIIAEHTADKFKYEYGALEYGEILDKAAVILDGGKTAIHRRIEKYGE